MIIPHLGNISNISRLGGGGGGGSLQKAYSFDGVNDYISGDATIGRTGYDINVAGNVYTGTDGFGAYINFNGNRDGGGATGTLAQIGSSSTPAYTQANNFSIKARVQPTALPSAGVSGLYGSSDDFCFYLNAAGNIIFTVKGSSTVTYTGPVLSVNTLYDIYMTYDSAAAKFYCYVDGTLQNVGGTSGPATFTANLWYVGDSAAVGTFYSASKAVYHACTRSRTLSQADIDADIALGNTTKSDPTIVAYYIPENLQYNTQYISNPKDLDNAVWSKGSGITVTANTTVAPDGTTTADNVVFAGGGLGSNVTQSITAITGANLASKTFVVKAFMKCAAGTQTVRLRCQHEGVSDYLSSNLTVTTDWQEFTFTQTFTSSTSGTGITAGIVQGSGAAAYTVQLWNVRLFLVNETLRDESPNIGGYIGWKTDKVFSCWVKPGADAANSQNSQALVVGPYAYTHIRDTTNTVRIRYDNRIKANESFYQLGNGFRSKVQIIGCFFWNGSTRATKIYINGVLQDSDARAIDAPTGIGPASGLLRLARYSSTYYTGLIRDARIYTGTITDADAMAIYAGGQPSTAILYQRYRPSPGESGTVAIDASGNNRNGTLNGGVTRVTRPST